MVKIERILVPVDFSERSQKAVLYGIEIAKSRNGKVFFLHVIHRRLVDNVERLSAWGYKGDVVQTMKNMVRERENDLQLAVPEKLRQGVEVEFSVKKGKPAEEIIQTARDLTADLVVMGTEGHSALASPLLGGVSQKVVNHAPCPVLVVRPLEHDFISRDTPES